MRNISGSSSSDRLRKRLSERSTPGHHPKSSLLRRSTVISPTGPIPSPSSARSFSSTPSFPLNGSERGRHSFSRVLVAVRLRPPLEMEQDVGIGMITAKAKERAILATTNKKDEHKRFIFDEVLSSQAKQPEVYRTLGMPLVDNVLKGYNGCIIAYGQTGAGKTYTLSELQPEKLGLIPRACQDLFDRIDSTNDKYEYHVQLSYLQIYMEMIQDLLHPDAQNLQIRESASGEVFVPGMSVHRCRSSQDVLTLLEHGEMSKAIAQTKLNHHSSRSHAVLTISLERKTRKNAVLDDDAIPEEARRILRSKFVFVDLAGSERAGKTHPEGLQLEEAKSINKSLAALGNVIAALAESSASQRRPTFIPWRDSKLTRLLQDVLGGNSCNSLIINIGPCNSNAPESLTSLLFGRRAMSVQVHPQVNEEIDFKALCDDLQTKLDSMAEGNRRLYKDFQIEAEELRSLNSQLESELGAQKAFTHDSTSEIEKWKQKALRLEEENKTLRVSLKESQEKNRELEASVEIMEQKATEHVSTPTLISPVSQEPGSSQGAETERILFSEDSKEIGSHPFVGEEGLTEWLMREAMRDGASDQVLQAISALSGKDVATVRREIQDRKRSLPEDRNEAYIPPNEQELKRQQMSIQLQDSLIVQIAENETTKRELSGMRRHCSQLEEQIAQLESSLNAVNSMMAIVKADNADKEETVGLLKTRLYNYGLMMRNWSFFCSIMGRVLNLFHKGRLIDSELPLASNILHNVSNILRFDESVPLVGLSLAPKEQMAVFGSFMILLCSFLRMFQFREQMLLKILTASRSDRMVVKVNALASGIDESPISLEEGDALQSTIESIADNVRIRSPLEYDTLISEIINMTQMTNQSGRIQSESGAPDIALPPVVSVAEAALSGSNDHFVGTERTKSAMASLESAHALESGVSSFSELDKIEALNVLCKKVQAKVDQIGSSSQASTEQVQHLDRELLQSNGLVESLKERNQDLERKVKRSGDERERTVNALHALRNAFETIREKKENIDLELREMSDANEELKRTNRELQETVMRLKSNPDAGLEEALWKRQQKALDAMQKYSSQAGNLRESTSSVRKGIAEARARLRHGGSIDLSSPVKPTTPISRHSRYSSSPSAITSDRTEDLRATYSGQPTTIFTSPVRSSPEGYNVLRRPAKSLEDLIATESLHPSLLARVAAVRKLEDENRAARDIYERDALASKKIYPWMEKGTD